MNKFIVLEGLDGSGKSTQAGRLREFFVSIGESCLLTFEPTNGDIGCLARSVTKGELAMEDETLALLFAADRHEHFAKKIAPALAGGGTVVCDRYYYSNMVYQGANEQTISRIFDYNRQVMQRPPDAVFFLDAPPQTCLGRLKSTREGISIYENLRHLEILYDRYHALFNRLAENIVTIKTAGKSAEDVTKEIIEVIQNLC